MTFANRMKLLSDNSSIITFVQLTCDHVTLALFDITLSFIHKLTYRLDSTPSSNSFRACQFYRDFHSFSVFLFLSNDIQETLLDQQFNAYSEDNMLEID